MIFAGQQPLKIAFFLHDLRGGGVERVSIHLANQMQKMGHSVDIVLVNRAGNPAYFDSIESEVRVLELRQSRTLTSAIGFRSYIKRNKPNMVISALTHINVSTLLATMLLRARPHVVVVEHNQQIGRLSRGEMKGLNHAVRIAFKLVPLLYKRADTIGSVSEGVKKTLAQVANIPASRITVLNNPVVVPDVETIPEATAVLPWIAKRDAPYVLGVGSLAYEKNFGLLIDAFARLRANMDVRLVIAGEGPERIRLEEAAAATGFGHDIMIAGYVPNPFALMRKASVLALTSRWEGLPTVLIEAMALGTSVVATDCPSGPGEILLDGELGSLVPPDDIDALTNALAEAIRRPQPVEKLRQRASDFQPAPAAQRYLDAYNAHASIPLLNTNQFTDSKSAA